MAVYRYITIFDHDKFTTSREEGDKEFNEYMQTHQTYLQRAYYDDGFFHFDDEVKRLKMKFPFLKTEQLPTILVAGTEATMDLGRPKGCVWENWIQDKIMFANDRAKLDKKIQEWEITNQNTPYQDATPLRTLFENIQDEMDDGAPATLPSVGKLTEEIRCRSALATRLTLIAIGDDVT